MYSIWMGVGGAKCNLMKHLPSTISDGILPIKARAISVGGSFIIPDPLIRGAEVYM
jgi:hypothetical protein